MAIGTPNMGAKTLTDSTMFFIVRFGVMGNSRKVSNSVLSTDADTTMMRVQKSLLDSPELDAIRKADGQLRTWLYNICLPYDMGIYILPIALWEQVRDKMDFFADERKELVNTFVDAYPTLCTNAAARLGSLHNPQDYLSVDAVREKFYFDYQAIKFSVPDSLKKISEEDYQNEMKKAEEKIAYAASEITALMRENLLELVDHLKSALEPNADGKPKRLFSSAVTNIQDFLDTFKARNVTNDSELDNLANQIKKIIHPNVYADVIRKDSAMRESIHKDMEYFSGRLSELVETIPSRKFRKD